MCFNWIYFQIYQNSSEKCYKSVIFLKKPDEITLKSNWKTSRLKTFISELRRRYEYLLIVFIKFSTSTCALFFFLFPVSQPTTLIQPIFHLPFQACCLPCSLCSCPHPLSSLVPHPTPLLPAPSPSSWPPKFQSFARQVVIAVYFFRIFSLEPIWWWSAEIEERRSGGKGRGGGEEEEVDGRNGHLRGNRHRRTQLPMH